MLDGASGAEQAGIVRKKMKLCPGPKCKQNIDAWKFCCPWHWGQLTDELRIGIIKLTGAAQAAMKQQAIIFLQGKQHEKDQQKQENSQGAETKAG